MSDKKRDASACSDFSQAGVKMFNSNLKYGLQAQLRHQAIERGHAAR